MIAYASRTGTKRNLEALRVRDFRLLVSAAGVLRTEGFQYALDNGAWSAFSQGRAFDDGLFTKALRLLGRNADWTVIPDIVAGGIRSLEMSLRWMRVVLDESPMGLLAVQDGMRIDDVRPFIGSRVGIFVGGSTDWKLKTTPEWAALAREIGAWCHVGRVNSAKRIVMCGHAGVTSFDGTSVTRFAETANLVDNARRQRSLWSLT